MPEPDDPDAGQPSDKDADANADSEASPPSGGGDEGSGASKDKHKAEGGKPTAPADLPGAEWPDPPPKRSRLRSSIFRERPRGKTPGSGGLHDGSESGRRFKSRFIVYCAVLLYLVLDLAVYRGPLKQAIESRRAFTATAAEKAKKYAWVAMVNGEPITDARLERAVDIHLYQRGRTRADYSDETMRYVRGAVLTNLIDDLLVEQHAAGRNHTISEAQVDAAVARFESQFKNPELLEQRAAAQHLDPAERRERIRQLALQTDWLESQLASAPPVTEEMARRWYEDNRRGEDSEGFTAAEAIRASHIFISTAVDDSPGKEQRIRELHRQLVEDGADFAALASSHSEDQRSKARGGDLNWFTRARMPAEFWTAVAGLAPGETSAPFRTPLGWHIARVTDRKPAREIGFEQLRDEILAYLQSEDRRQKIEEFLLTLRQASIIQVFPEQL